MAPGGGGVHGSGSTGARLCPVISCHRAQVHSHLLPPAKVRASGKSAPLQDPKEGPKATAPFLGLLGPSGATRPLGCRLPLSDTAGARGWEGLGPRRGGG